MLVTLTTFTPVHADPPMETVGVVPIMKPVPVIVIVSPPARVPLVGATLV
jgi:hypothetical protein